jgi:uncharacterized protein YcgI (DUF1989 family)
MPLLMLSPDPGPLPQTSDFVVPGGEVKAVIICKGQLLAIRDIEGGQPAGLWASVLEDAELVLSPHHTRVFSNSFMLRLGMRLVTNRRRTVMVLGVSAPHLRHDLLMPLTEASVNGAERGADCVRSKVTAAFAAVGIQPRKSADPVNLFLDVAVGPDGSLTPRGASSRPGDTVLFRVVTDLAVAVSAPGADPLLWDRASPGPIAVRVRNEVAEFEDWLKQGS